MRTCRFLIPAVLAFAIPAVPAMARTTGGISAGQAWSGNGAAIVTSRNGNFTIGDTGRDSAILLSRLQERNFANSNDTIEQEADGGSGVGGAAGGVGAR